MAIAEPHYIYDQAWQKERERLAGIETLYDPGTIRRLESLGIRPGWRCLEVGAGGGSIALWLCNKIGWSGAKVVATDVDTRFLEALNHPNLEIRQHNILHDDLETERFDLIHTRMLLAHLPDREAALSKMVAALKPGGWLFVEDIDATATLSDPQATLNEDPRLSDMMAVSQGLVRLFDAAGIDYRTGRLLPSMLIRQGLTEIDCEMNSVMIRGGSPRADFYRLSIEFLGNGLIGSGLVSKEQLKRAESLLDDPLVSLMSLPMVGAWGRRPC